MKTKQNDASVISFLDSVDNAKRKEDAFKVLDIMQRISGEKPKMWGDSIVGFGKYHYKYDSGREGDMLKLGFSPRKQSLVLYIISGFSRYGQLMKRLGKHKTGKSCLYINKLEDVDLEVLEELIGESLKHVEKKYNC